TGNVATDQAIMRAMGAADAAANPSGHKYLQLLAIGGQDEADQGVILSATSRDISYSGIVAALQAYADGYASAQKAYAPMLFAIDTNNDIDVSTGSGISYAQHVINPVQAYVAARYPGITV